MAFKSWQFGRLLQIGFISIVTCSRDEDMKSVEVAAGSHLIANKGTASGSMLSEVHDHAFHQQDIDRRAGESSSSMKLAPSMREQLIAFSRAAQKALAHKNNNSQGSGEQKQQDLQDAIAQAAHVVTSLAATRDSSKTPEHVKVALQQLQELKKTPSALVQLGAEAKQAPASSQTLREKLAAFGKLARESLERSHADDMKDHSKLGHLHGALSSAADAMSSLAVSVDSDRHPKLAESLAQLQTVGNSKHSTKQAVSSLTVGADAKIQLSTEMKEQIKAFSRAAVEALRNSEKQGEGASPERQAAQVQGALSQAANLMSSLAHTHADMNKSPELAHRLESLKQLTAPSLFEKHEESAAVNSANDIVITPEMRSQIQDFGKAAVEALRNAKMPDSSKEQRTTDAHTALEQASKIMSSLSQTHANNSKVTDLARRLATLQQSKSQSFVQTAETVTNREAKSSSSKQNEISSEMRQQIKSFSEVAQHALISARQPDADPEQQAQRVHGALSQAARIMISLAHKHADMAKVPELAKRLAVLKELTPEV